MQVKPLISTYDNDYFFSRADMWIGLLDFSELRRVLISCYRKTVRIPTYQKLSLDVAPERTDGSSRSTSPVFGLAIVK